MGHPCQISRVNAAGVRYQCAAQRAESVFEALLLGGKIHDQILNLRQSRFSVIPPLRQAQGRDYRKLSKQPLLPLQVSKRSDIRQGESEAVLVLIAVDGGAQREASILKTDAAAIPVIGCLRSRILQQIELAVKSDIGGGAPS